MEELWEMTDDELDALNQELMAERARVMARQVQIAAVKQYRGKQKAVQRAAELADMTPEEIEALKGKVLRPNLLEVGAELHST